MERTLTSGPFGAYDVVLKCVTLAETGHFAFCSATISGLGLRE
jgi:hypothetical protein